MGLSSPYPVHFRQLWHCHPHQHPPQGQTRPILQLTKKPLSNPTAVCTVGFPESHLLRHFSSVTSNFSKWHKCRRTSGSVADTQKSCKAWPFNLHKIPCAEAVTGKQVGLYVPLGLCQIVLAQNELFLYQHCFCALR